MSRWPGYLPEVQDYEMRTRDEAKPHAPTRAELEDLFRDAVASLDEPNDDEDDDGERYTCDECGDSFNGHESGDDYYCVRCLPDKGGEG